MLVSPSASEFKKYAANAFLAMRIITINEIADLCEKADADVGNAKRGMGLGAQALAVAVAAALQDDSAAARYLA